MRAHPLLLAFASAALAAGCDSPSGDAGSGPAASVAILSGAEQTGTAGERLGAPLVVRVTDARGRPVHQHRVEFVASGGGSVEPSAVLTNADGRAGAWWTLGTSIADSQRVEARVQGEGSEPLAAPVFSARATVGAPARLEGGGELPAWYAGETRPDSVAVRVVDRHGNPVPGAEVTWTVAVGEGAASPARSTADAAGVARTQWQHGDLFGTTHVLTAAVGPLNVRWTSLAQRAEPESLQWVELRDWQAGRPGHAVREPVVARLSTVRGTPVRRTWVRLTGADGVTVTDSALTDAQGQVTFPLVLGNTIGEQAFKVYVPGTGLHLTAHGYAHPATPEIVGDIWSVVNGRWRLSLGIYGETGDLTGYPVHATLLTGDQRQVVLARVDAHDRVEFEWPFASNPHLVVDAGPTRREMRLTATLWITPLHPPGGELTPSTRFVVHAEQGIMFAFHDGMNGKFPTHLIVSRMRAYVHDRTVEFGTGSRQAPFSWGPAADWLDGLPEGPTTIRFHLEYSHFVGGHGGTQHGAVDLPVVLRGTR